MVRQDGGFDPVVLISSVADYIEMKTDRDGLSASVWKRGYFQTIYTRAKDFVVSGSLVLANCADVVLILVSSA